MFKLKQLLGSGHVDPIYALEMEFFVNNSTWYKKFNEIAKKYNYFFKGDVQNVIFELTKSKDIERDIARLEMLSSINKINYEDESFKIETSFGNFEFKSASSEYPLENEKIIELAKKEKMDQYRKSNLEYMCHFASQEFVKIYPENYLVTCMCPHIFNSTWWLHSYVLDESQNTVIDFANNIVMQKEMFNFIFEPNNLFKFQQSDIDIIMDFFRTTNPYKNCEESKVLSNIALRERAKQLQKKI